MAVGHLDIGPTTLELLGMTSPLGIIKRSSRVELKGAIVLGNTFVYSMLIHRQLFASQVYGTKSRLVPKLRG